MPHQTIRPRSHWSHLGINELYDVGCVPELLQKRDLVDEPSNGFWVLVAQAHPAGASRQGSIVTHHPEIANQKFKTARPY